MIYHIGDKVSVDLNIDNKTVSKNGKITNIRYDAVANDYEVTFDDNSKGHFCNFRLKKQ